MEQQLQGENFETGLEKGMEDLIGTRIQEVRGNNVVRYRVHPRATDDLCQDRFTCSEGEQRTSQTKQTYAPNRPEHNENMRGLPKSHL